MGLDPAVTLTGGWLFCGENRPDRFGAVAGRRGRQRRGGSNESQLRLSPMRHTTVDVTKDERSERINVRVSPREVAMLDALAEDAGLSSADIVRLLVRDAYRAKFGDKAPKIQK